MVIPPLRDRREDILPLAHFFIEQFNRKLRRQVEGMSPEACQLLVAHTWPGKVRELRNVMYRISCLAGDIADVDHLPSDMRPASPVSSSNR